MMFKMKTNMLVDIGESFYTSFLDVEIISK